MEIEKALDLSPNCALLRILQTKSLIGMKCYYEATQLVNDLLNNDPKNADALYLKGMITLCSEGEISKASNLFLEALKFDPDHELSRLKMKKMREQEKKKGEGNAVFEAGDYQRAKGIYSEAIEIDPENPFTVSVLYSNRASTNLKMKNYSDAIRDCDQALEANPRFSKVYLKRADAYMKTQNYEKAVHDYQAAKDLDPKNENMAYLLREAKRQLKKAQRKDYYKILEIEKDVDENEIKKAYKKMALKCHPDKNFGEGKEAEAKFKEVGEAYAVLSDPNKRARYDSGIDLEDGFSGVNSGVSSDLSAIFKMFFESQDGRGYRAPPGNFRRTSGQRSRNHFHATRNPQNFGDH